jgi:MFS transporter, SHS family, lactate transporter
MSEPEKQPVDVQPEGGIHQTQSGHPPHHGMSAGEYIKTRFTTLKPPMAKAPNPFRLVAKLTGRQWAFFFVAFIAWVSLILHLFPAGGR